MSTNVYKRGSLVRVAAKFADAAGNPIDPAAIRIKYRAPGLGTTTLTFGVDAAVIKDSPGVYHADINASSAGIWRYRWESDAPSQAANEAQFYVDASYL